MISLFGIRGFPPISAKNAEMDGARELVQKQAVKRTSAVSLKFIEEQPQILRLTTPELKDVRGPVRSE